MMEAWTFSQRGQPVQVLKLYHQVPIPQTEKADEGMVKISYDLGSANIHANETFDT